MKVRREMSVIALYVSEKAQNLTETRSRWAHRACLTVSLSLGALCLGCLNEDAQDELPPYVEEYSEDGGMYQPVTPRGGSGYGSGSSSGSGAASGSGARQPAASGAGAQRSLDHDSWSVERPEIETEIMYELDVESDPVIESELEAEGEPEREAEVEGRLERGLSPQRLQDAVDTQTNNGFSDEYLEHISSPEQADEIESLIYDSEK